MELNDRIKAWRHALGLTQDEFARKAGMSKASLVGYEVGQRKPGSEALAAIARTGANMTWLLTGEGEMVSKELKTQQIRAFQTDAVFRQLEKIGELLDALPEHKRTDLLAEFLSRAEDAAEFISVVRQINELRAAQKKSA
ncbi:MAG: helix-turn-helix domain-containing protein [Burkholderiaceae bacterium]|nr:helix-turn-helix domain-containing protein [Burkholderiaceae bacterium]